MMPASIIFIVLLTRHLDASILMAISANICCTIWNLMIGVLNCFLSFAYFTDSSNARCMMPTARVATNARDKFKAFIASLKPLPSGPTMADAFTRTFSKIRSVVLDRRRPILFS